jgi:hypothetical protein
MKKILFVFLILTAIALPQTGKHLWAYDSVLVLQPTDYIGLQRGSYGNGYWKKMFAANLFGQIRDTTEAYNYGDKDLVNTWAKHQTFSLGATYSAGASGKVTFADSVIISTDLYMTGVMGFIYARWIQPTTASGSVGALAKYYTAMYAQNFVLVNAGGTDSANIKINGTTGNVEIDNLTITDKIDMSDSAIINGIRLSEYHYTIAASSDSVITIPAMQSSIYLTEGWAVPGIETLTMVGAGDGQVLVITNASNYAVTFEDNATTGGNLDIGSNFACGITDIIALKYLAAKGRWSQMYRSDN